MTGKTCLAALLIAAALLFHAAPAACGPPDFAFDGADAGGPPHGWSAMKGDPAKVYSVRRSEGGTWYVRGDARSSAVQLGCEKEWSLAEYPILTWRWRAVRFPDGSDERKKGHADSVLGLYVGFGHWPFTRFIKYVWSDTLPVGETFGSPYSSRTRMIVIRSGREAAGTWVTETRDVLADYRRLFKKEKPPEARGIAILTDADDTRSHAIGDYADIKLLPR